MKIEQEQWGLFVSKTITWNLLISLSFWERHRLWIHDLSSTVAFSSWHKYFFSPPAQTCLEVCWAPSCMLRANIWLPFSGEQYVGKEKCFTFDSLFQSFDCSSGMFCILRTETQYRCHIVTSYTEWKTLMQFIVQLKSSIFRPLFVEKILGFSWEQKQGGHEIQKAKQTPGCGKVSVRYRSLVTSQKTGFQKRVIHHTLSEKWSEWKK